MSNHNKEKGIMTLAFLMIAGLFLLGLALIITTGTVVGLKKNVNTKSGNQSFYTAEAAAREGVYQYAKNDKESGNFSLLTNEIPPSSISFSVLPSPRGWAYKEVWGDAENNITHRKVNNTLLLFPGGQAFDYAVYSENNLTIKGSANIIGNIFSNNLISCIGNNVSIEGGAYSDGPIDDNCDDNVESINESANFIPAPDIDPFYYGDPSYGGIADCTSTAADVKNDCLSGPTTGVVFVDDPGEQATLNNINLTGNLTIIGDLNIGGGSVINASNDYAAIVVDGNLKVTGNNTINGLVYVSGNTTFGSGNTTINGSLISKGGTETNIAGNVTIDYQSLSGPPGGIDPSGTPEIINWNEE